MEGHFISGCRVGGPTTQHAAHAGSTSSSLMCGNLQQPNSKTVVYQPPAGTSQINLAEQRKIQWPRRHTNDPKYDLVLGGNHIPHACS
jgi:hypothetical protein